jgi:DNA-binding NtrC family response regulator
VKQPEIIVVDDEPGLLLLARKRLTSAGFTVIEARSGVSALKAAVEHPECRFMVTDYVMPELGGDLWIRLLERFCGDWTIAVVSSQDVDPGPFLYVPKPVDYDNLVAVFGRLTRP